MKATELTQSEKIRLLATQGMGWEAKNCFSGPGTEGMLRFHRHDKCAIHWWPGCLSRVNDCWNPFTSLDTVAEIEARLTDEQWSRYIEALRHPAVEEKVYLHNSWSRFLVQLSAAQRSEALVEVLA